MGRRGRMKLGEWLKAHNVTAPAFAKQIGVDRSNVTRWIAGDVRPGWDLLPKIIEATGGHVTANDFLPEGVPPQEVNPSAFDPPAARCA